MDNDNRPDRATDSGDTKGPASEDGKLYERLTPFRMAAKFTSIPMTLLACTIVGYALGAFIEKKHPTGGVFVMVFVMLGVAAGFKEILELLKKPAEKGAKVGKKGDKSDGDGNEAKKS